VDVSDPEKCLLDAALANDVRAVKTLALMDLKGLKKHVDYALLYAVMAGSYDVVETFFWHGASLDAKDPFNNLTLWDCARRSPDPQAMIEFLSQMKSGAMASKPIRALLMASRKPSKERRESSQPASSVVRRGTKNSIRKLPRPATV